MGKIVITVFCLLFNILLWASPKIKSDFVYARGGESLYKLLSKNVGIPKKLLDNGLYNKIKKWNPHIEDIKNLNRGERVYIEIPYNTVLTHQRVIPVATKIEKQPEIIKEKPVAVAQVEEGEPNVIERVVYLPHPLEYNPWSLVGFYSISAGSYLDASLDGDVVTTSSQDSPLTLGVSLTNKLSQRWNFSGSFYISKLDNGETEGSEEIVIPWEFGLTSHFSYKLSFTNWIPYAGVDFEHFPVFNTDEVAEGYPLSTREHELMYATFGFNRAFNFLKKNWFLKLSASQSIYSTVSRKSYVNGGTPYSGQKFIGHLTYLYSQRLSFSTFLKQHILTGPTDLSITRFGLGIGYKFQ